MFRDILDCWLSALIGVLLAPLIVIIGICALLLAVIVPRRIEVVTDYYPIHPERVPDMTDEEIQEFSQDWHTVGCVVETHTGTTKSQAWTEYDAKATGEPRKTTIQTWDGAIWN